MPFKENFKILKVTTEVQYYVPMPDEDIVKEDVGELRSMINGWTISEVIENWFKTHDINQHHVTRDSYQIGNSRKILGIEVLNNE